MYVGKQVGKYKKDELKNNYVNMFIFSVKLCQTNPKMPSVY